MRTIPNIAHLLKKVDDIILTEFIPSITNGIIINELEQHLLSLPTKYGGLGIPIFSKTSQIEYENSLLITEHLRNNIVDQNIQYESDPNIMKKKNQIKAAKANRNHELLQNLKAKMSPSQIRRNELNCEAGASIWLTSLPLKDEGYILNKQTFWDLIRIRYGWELLRLPENCECGSKFSVEHALSCKKGGFITLRHNQIRNLTAGLLKEVCHDVCIEPRLQQLTGESLIERSANKSADARLDVSARSFWITSQTAFFDVRVFNPMAKRYVNQELPKAYDINEKEKKRSYNERVMQVEHGSFTPLVMSASGGMGRECRRFYARLAEMLSEKRKQNYSLITSWIRRKICFALMNSLSMCLRGSRTVFSSQLEFSLSQDAKVSEMASHIE